MSRQLQNLVAIGKLKREPSSELEIAGLIRSGREHTVQLPKAQWRVLDEAHRRRNIAEYEGGMDLDAELVAALLRVAQEVAKRVQELAARSR
jgi:hypothetical protein